MASRSSVMNRVQMFEVSSTKEEPVSTPKLRRLPQAPNQLCDYVDSRTSPYRAPKPTVAESVDWPLEDEDGIPVPSSQRGYGENSVCSRDAPPAPRYHHQPGSPRSSRSTGPPHVNTGSMREAPQLRSVHHPNSPRSSKSHQHQSPRSSRSRQRSKSPRSSRSQRHSSPRAGHSNNPASPREGHLRKPQSPISSQPRQLQSPRSSNANHTSSPRSSNVQRPHSPMSFNSQQPQSPRSSKAKPRPTFSTGSASEKRDAPPLKMQNHTQASPMVSGRPSKKGERRSPSVSSSTSSYTPQVYTERREEHRRIPSQDENSNPVQSKDIVVGWPSEEHDINPAKQPQRRPAPKSVGGNRPSGMSGRLSKIKTSARRRSPSPLMMEQLQPPRCGTREESASSERFQREQETRSHLNLALKRSLDDASTVLQEERASSVATSSSSLSSDELTSIAKRALQTAHKKSLAEDADRDDVSVVSTSSKTSLSSSRSRLSRYSAARKKTAIARKRADNDDASVGASVHTGRSGSPSVRASPQSQRNKNPVSAATAHPSGACMASKDKMRATLPRGVPTNEPSSAKDVSDDVSVVSQSSLRSQRIGRRLSHLQATDKRGTPSPLVGRSQGASTQEPSDDVSVGSPPSRRSQRLSERLSHLQKTDRRRSSISQVGHTLSHAKDPKVNTGEGVTANVDKVKEDVAKAREHAYSSVVKEVVLGNDNSDIGDDRNINPTREENSPVSVKVNITLTSSEKDETRDVSPLVLPRLASPRAQRSSTRQAVLDAAERSRSPMLSATKRSQPDLEDDESVVSVSSLRSTGSKNGWTRREAFAKANNKKRLPASLSPAVSLELKRAEELRKRAQRKNSASPARSRLSAHRAFATPKVAVDERTQAKMNAWCSRTNPRKQGGTAPSQPNESSTIDLVTDGTNSVFSLESDDFEDVLNSEADAPGVLSQAHVEDDSVNNSEQPLTPADLLEVQGAITPIVITEHSLGAHTNENEAPFVVTVESNESVLSPQAQSVTTVQLVQKEVSVAAPHPEEQCPETCYSSRSNLSPEKPLAAHNAYLAHLEKKKVPSAPSPNKTGDGLFAQISLNDSDSRASGAPSTAPLSSVQRLLATAAVAKKRELYLDANTGAFAAMSQASSRKSASKRTNYEQDNEASSRVWAESMPANSLYFSESDNESALSIMSKSNNILSPKEEERVLVPQPLPKDESAHYDDEANGQGELEEASDSQSMYGTDNEGSTLIGQLHVDSKGSQTEHEGSTLLGQLSEDSKGSEELLPRYLSQEEVQSTTSDDNDKAQKVSRAKNALNWWQKKYSRNQNKNVNHVVEDTLTPTALTMALDCPERENYLVHDQKEKQSEESQMSSSKGASQQKSSGMYSDEESVFSGLDGLTKAESDARSLSSSIASQTNPVMLPAVLSNELCTKSRGGIVITKSSRSKEGKSMAPPTPPPQEHCGEVLDQSQLVDTVNSDITSSVIATEGVNHAVGWSKKSSLVITEEKSDEIAEEDETIPSNSPEEEMVKSPIAKSKSQLSKKSQKKKKQSTKSLRPEKPERPSKRVARAVNKEEGSSRRSREEQPIKEEGDPIFGSTVFMKIGTAILETFEIVCHMPDPPSTPESRRARFDSNIDSSDAHSIAGSAISQSTMNDREAKKWDEWDRRETESAFTTNTEEGGSRFTDGFTADSRTAISEGDASTSSNVFERQAAAHQKLVRYTKNAMSTVPSQETSEESKEPQSGAETSAFASSSEEEESSYSDTSAKNEVAPVIKRNKPHITITTVGTPMNHNKPPTHKALPSALSLNQSRILEKFCSSLKNQGIEILKQTRDSKWQVRYLTVSKELTEIKHVKLGNQDGVRCPSALLWLKRFNPKSKDYSASLIDKHGKGGVFLSHLVKVTATGRSDPANNLPKKFQEKYKESVTVIVEYNMGDGTTRSMALRCKTTDEAHFLCTGMRVCMDVLKRDEEADK